MQAYKYPAFVRRPKQCQREVRCFVEQVDPGVQHFLLFVDFSRHRPVGKCLVHKRLIMVLTIDTSTVRVVSKDISLFRIQGKAYHSGFIA